MQCGEQPVISIIHLKFTEKLDFQSSGHKGGEKVHSQSITALVTKPDDFSSTPRNHIMDG